MGLSFYALALANLLALIGLVAFLRWSFVHRRKHSTSVALRNLRSADPFAASDEEDMTEERRQEVIALIGAIKSNSRIIEATIRRGLYLGVLSMAAIGACFSVNVPSIGRLAMIAVAAAFVLLLILLSIRPFIRAARTNMRLGAQFELWAQSHPGYSEKRRHPQSQSEWQKR
ncbi:MAG: hypothetical protein LKI34_04595 [Bifidobacterium tibiigranuli]|jgi:hypothetical protein|uniref:hypothetical protein n=1 Tax=Bifidobacterium tibiigranuli TaxID=2172043 RepID=UPI0026F33491|nr:hypothetical protein [Bifidobacterium tibiigranuli]MCI1673480.1 hypothetical protein [Bifidobacterium tibiigranuli]MCI1712780.1 hypothetical protein [Bifidobacterium tibiigranuli]